MGKEITTTFQPSKEEIAIVKLLASGATNNEIATKLDIDVTKIISGLYSLRIKYNCKNSIELTALFLREKLIN